MNYKDKFNMSIEENIFFMKRNIVDLVWKSSNLEGIAVTYPETQMLFDGMVSKNMKLKDVNAMINLKKSWEFIETYIEYEIDYNYLCKINNIVGAENVVYNAGYLRSEDVNMGGTTWKPEIPKKEDIEKKIKELYEETGKNKTEKGIKIMLYLMRTQPFNDGNKRTAMLIANHYLIQQGKGIISISTDNLTIFREKLIKFYETNDGEDIKEFIYKTSLIGTDYSKQKTQILEEFVPTKKIHN